MAKVIAPLQSFSASGKIGKSLVFFSHLGRNVVRQLVTPANPKTKEQGSQRLLIGALGGAVRGVGKDSVYQNDAKSGVPTGQTWVSDLVKTLSATYGAGSAGVTALKSAFGGASKDDVFESQAGNVGLTGITVSYADTDTNISAGAQLFVLAVYAFNRHAKDNSIFTDPIYNTNPTAWTSANITTFISDLQSA